MLQSLSRTSLIRRTTALTSSTRLHMADAAPKQKQVATETRGADEYNARWERSWASGLKPGDGFDASRSSRALTNLLKREPKIANGKSVLIPGCGRGYDLAAFVQAGAQKATGLELAPTAASDANAYIASLPDFGAEGQRFFGLASVQSGNFFDILKQEGSSISTEGTFDVGFDYTFLCAIQRNMHHLWADSWAANLKPGGELITLMYPIAEQMTMSDVGPPWPLTVELYSQLLLPGFQLISVQKVPEDESHPGREGREWIGRWRRSPVQ